MSITHPLTAALGLLLLAPQGTLAHQGHPRNVSMEYSEPATKEIEFSFNNTTSDLNAIAVNWCEAKETLPPDWQDGPPAPISTAKQCKTDAVFRPIHDRDFGDIAFNIPSGKYTYTPPNADKMPMEPGDYVVSIVLYTHSESGQGPTDHHDGGLHQTITRITLELPVDDEDGDGAG